MNLELLKRNDEKIKKLLNSKKDGIECLDTLYVLFPKRFEDKGLATIDDVVEVLGVCLVMDKDYNYTVFKLPNLLRFSPIAIESFDVNGKEYIKMEFMPPNFIIAKTVIDSADPVFIMLEDWPVRANFPFYVTKDEVLQIITKSVETTSTKLGKFPNRFSSLLAVSSRDKSGKMESRHIPNIKETKWVGLIDASAIYNNNLSRLIGGYLNKGMTVGILEDKTEKTELEKVLRR